MGQRRTTPGAIRAALARQRVRPAPHPVYPVYPCKYLALPRRDGRGLGRRPDHSLPVLERPLAGQRLQAEDRAAGLEVVLER